MARTLSFGLLALEELGRVGTGWPTAPTLEHGGGASLPPCAQIFMNVSLI